MPTSSVVPARRSLRRCACGGSCAACREGGTASAADASHVAVSPTVDDVLRSPGRALDTGDRDFFEPRYGVDLSRVRVHDDARASASARAMSARAYTVGDHVVFGAGRTPADRPLLAHELAHVVQQRGTAATGPLETTVAGGAIEADADRLAASALSGGDAHRPIASPTVVARAPDAGATAKPCPRTHTIPDDVHAAIATAWAASNHGGETVTEQGGRIVTDKDGKRIIRTGAGGSGSISLPDEKTGDTTLGTFHTHPYSKAEGSNLGVTFSGGDITNFIAGGQGDVKYIGAGSCIFALTTVDATARDSCKSVDTAKRWNDAFAAASGTFEANAIASVAATIVGCGICHYSACRPNARSAIPKTATAI